MERLKKAQYIALGATVLSIIGGLLGGMSGSDLGMSIMGIGFVAGVVAYCFGGLGKALKMAGSIAKWGWLVFPFPYDLITLPIAFFVAILALVFLPIIPVRMAYCESKKY